MSGRRETKVIDEALPLECELRIEGCKVVGTEHVHNDGGVEVEHRIDCSFIPDRNHDVDLKATFLQNVDSTNSV